MSSSCVCVCVCVSVTLRYCFKTAKRRITQTTPHDSPMTLVFLCQISWRNSNGITPRGDDKCRWGRLKFVVKSRIGSRMCSIEWLCFRWLWVTPNPQTIQIFALFVAFHIFVVSKHRDFIFGVQVDDKPSLKGAWLRHVTRVKFWQPHPYCRNGRI